MLHSAEEAIVNDSTTGVRVGVFGGTFDPLHIGHLMIALEVRHALSLDRMLFVVANDPWQKDGSPVSSADARLDLVVAAVNAHNARVGFEAVEACDLEIARGGKTYTADTLAQLRAAQPDDDLFLLVGSDAAGALLSWERPNEVRALATTVVVERGGHEGGRPPEGWPYLFVEVPLMEVSSSDLRARFLDGRPVEALMPSAVIDGVRRLGLYRTSS